MLHQVDASLDLVDQGFFGLLLVFLRNVRTPQSALPA